MRVNRLISILLLIEAKGIIKAKDLASKLEISLRTVYRDIEALCEAGIPITTTTGPNGGIGIMEGYTREISQLQEEEIINLYLSGIGIKPDTKSEMSIKLNNALLKIEKGLSQKQSSQLRKIIKKFHFDQRPWWGGEQQIYPIDTIMYSLFQSRVLKLKYKKFNGELSERRTHPYGIVVKNKVDWYLIAFCEATRVIKTFKCNRIIEVEDMNEEFILPEDFSLEEYWNEAEGNFKAICNEKERYIVEIKLHKSKIELLNGFEIYQVKEENDDIIAEVNLYEYETAKERIMAILGWAEVIKPIELRGFVVAELNDILTKYQIKQD